MVVPPPKKKPVRVKKRGAKKKKGAPTPQVVAAPVIPALPVSLTDKDAWGYQFSHTMWRYEPGISDGMRRDPNDAERLRVLRVLEEVYELRDPKRLDQGFTNDSLPWGLMHHDRLTPRKKLAERIRTVCLKAPNGRLGIAQLRYLLTDAELMSTLVVRSKGKTFPLDVEITDPVLKKTWIAKHTRHLDRVFYLIQPASPPPGRFDPPLCVVDPMRFDHQSGYALARNAKKQPLVSVDTKDLDASIFKLEVSTTRPLHFRENRQRDPAGDLLDDERVVGRCVSLSKSGDVGLTFRVEIDLAGPQMPWLALAVVLADVWVQRATGVMHRAVTVEREKVEREKQEADDLLLAGVPASMRHRMRPMPPKKP